MASGNSSSSRPLSQQRCKCENPGCFLTVGEAQMGRSWHKGCKPHPASFRKVDMSRMTQTPGLNPNWQSSHPVWSKDLYGETLKRTRQDLRSVQENKLRKHTEIERIQKELEELQNRERQLLSVEQALAEFAGEVPSTNSASVSVNNGRLGPIPPVDPELAKLLVPTMLVPTINSRANYALEE